MTKLSPEATAFARRLGGDLSLEDNRALFVRRVCRQLNCTEDQLLQLGVSEKMALIALLSQSVLDSNAN